MNPSELAEAFARRGVKHCIVGGVAATLHGVLRDTLARRDLDVLLVPTATNLRDASLALADLGLRPHVPVKLEDLAEPSVRLRLREERNLVALGYVDASNPLRRVDVLMDGPFDVEEVVGRAVEHAGLRVICLSTSWS